jgi:glycosyltransferase involved in cell wall biosynthesis
MLTIIVVRGGRRRVLFFNLGGGPHQGGDSFAFTEGGLAHAVNSFIPLADDFETTVICPNVPLDVAGRRFEVGGVVIDCPAPPRFVRWMWPDEFSFTERSLYTWARLPAVLESYARLSRFAIHARPDVVLANGVLGAYLAGRNWPHFRVIAVVHHLYQDAWTRGSDEARHGFLAFAERWLLHHMKVDGVAVVNPAVRERLVEQGFDAGRMEMVGNGVDPRFYRFAGGGGSNLIYVGRLRKDKRVDVLIDAMALIRRERPDVVLHIVGDGRQRDSLRRLAGRHGLDGAVVFHGFVDEQSKAGLLRSSSIYLSASQFEGFGIPVVEAMASGAVPVVSDIPAHRFIFQERAVGCLASGPEQTAACVLRLLRDGKERAHLASEGRRLVEERWTWDEVARRYARLIDSVCDSRRVVGPA